jgi:hypothetical protein
MNRREACLAQAAACRARAETDPANRDRWINEAIDWLERAAQSPGRVAMTFEGKHAVALTTPDPKIDDAASAWNVRASANERPVEGLIGPHSRSARTS